MRPAEPHVFFLRDTNPNKPERLLALPRHHGEKPQHLADSLPNIEPHTGPRPSTKPGSDGATTGASRSTISSAAPSATCTSTSTD